MTDSKLVQGLIIAACLFLAFGILSTVVETNSYKSIGPASAGPAPRTGTSSPDEGTAPADTPVEDTAEDTPSDAT